MPLDKKVTFQTRLQSQNRLQVPSHLRWQFKLEPAELLKVTAKAVGVRDTLQIFYANMQKKRPHSDPKTHDDPNEA